jgi:dTDP-4-amino-4,6-dideoxygalactose transaminase
MCTTAAGLPASQQHRLRLTGDVRGAQIITQANTYVATCLGMSNVGASIVLVDAERDSFLMDVSQLEAAITPRTKAIVPVHLYGQCCDMDAIMEIAARHGVTVVEDVAQAAGALYKVCSRTNAQGSVGSDLNVRCCGRFFSWGF